MVDIEDLDMINLFRVSGPLGYLLGATIGGLVSAFLPIQFIFLFVAVILLAGFYYIYILEDTK
jgi:predicted MFS family arabinose efflux permease